MDRPKNPQVFISYAHKDAWEFAGWIDLALQLYGVNVFCDRRIAPGQFRDELLDQVKKRDFFLAIMTPYSKRNDSFCRQEIAWAKEYKRKIIPIRLHEETDQEIDDFNTRADFTDNYYRGFRKLTYLLLGEPKSPWEFLAYESNQALLEHLAEGHIPSLIAQTIGDWVVMNKLWAKADRHITKYYGESIINLRGNPRTPYGVMKSIDPIIQLAANVPDVVTVLLLEEVKKIVKEYLEDTHSKKFTEHQLIGQATGKIVAKTKEFLLKRATLDNIVMDYEAVDKYYNFDVAEKLRELVVDYSRRSKYLY